MNSFGIRRKNHIMWHPTKLSGGTIYAWFDASRLDTFTLGASGGINYVVTWKSIVSGDTRYFTSDPARRPYRILSPYNGRQCVTFNHANSDDSGDYLIGTNVGAFASINAQLHMFAACRQTMTTVRAATSDTTENYMSILTWEGYHGEIALQCNSSGYQNGVLTEWWNSAQSVAKSTGLTVPSLHLKLSCFGGSIYGGTTGTWWTSTHLRNYVAPRISTTEATNRKSYTATDCRMGAAKITSATYAYPLGGEVYELLMIYGNITEQTKVKMLEYLSARWGP